MQYKSENEEVVMLDTSYTPIPNLLTPTGDLQIKRTRKILMIILGVCMTLSVTILISVTFASDLKIGGGNTQRSRQIGEILIAVLFYGFGLFAVHRYSTLCLRIFACLMIIKLVVIGILLGFLLLIALATLIDPTPVGDVHSKSAVIGETVTIIIFGVMLTAIFILSVIIVEFSFKLVRLIDANKRLIIQQF